MQKKFNRWKSRHQRLSRKRIRRLKVASKHPFSVPIIFFVILILATACLVWYNAQQSNDRPIPTTRVVIISHDHEQQTVPSNEPNVGDLLNKLAITLNPGDVVEPSEATVINQDDFRINIYRALPVKIIDGSSVTFTTSAATTPRSIAQQAGLNPYPEDTLATVPVTNFVTEGSIGETVAITRSTPVDLNLYGTPIATRTQAKTVGALLADKHISLKTGDTLSPAATTPISNNQLIFVIRNGSTVQNVTQTIAMPIQAIQDPSLAYGTNAIRQQGSPGSEVVTYQVTTQNGQPVARSIIQTVVTTQPVTEIVVQGTSLSGIKGDMAQAGIAASDYTYVDYIVSHESGWCPTKAQGEYGTCPAYSGSVPSYGGYGLCQATPGIKMESAGSDWATNPITQLRWCSGYANSRYGSWSGAYEHWIAHGNW
jgi:uncharacterized protein YabE (DUF348 family)